MPDINQTFIENKMREYLAIQKKVNIVNLREQFSGFSPDLVESALNDLIDTNEFMTRFDEQGREFIYLGPTT